MKKIINIKITTYFIALSFIAVKGLIVVSIFDDPFHAGEFFASGTFFTKENNLTFLPYTIHGALDFIPMLLANYTWGENNYFFGTSLIYSLTNATSALLLLLIFLKITPESNYKPFFIILISFSSFNFVGIRDLFLLFSILSFLHAMQHKESILLQLIFGFIVSLGVFWSFDRGIAAVISLGSAITYLSIYNIKHLYSILSFIISLCFFSFYFDVFSIDNYTKNLIMLLETSKQWKYPWTTGVINSVIFVTAFNAFSIYIFIKKNIENKEKTVNDFAIAIFMILLSLLLLKAGTNRADTGHLFITLWVPLLMLLSCKKTLNQSKTIFAIAVTVLLFWIDKFGMAIIITLIALTLIYNNNLKILLEKYNKILIALLLIFSLFKILETSDTKSYSWLIGSLKKPPTNEQMATDSIKWVASILKSKEVKCIFDLSNNGVINGITNLPSCSRFTYPVYATQKYEPILIEDLNTTKPSAIVYSSTYWSYAIDGSSMKDRFPKLDYYILETYPYEECNLGYCVRYRNEEKNQ